MRERIVSAESAAGSFHLHELYRNESRHGSSCEDGGIGKDLRKITTRFLVKITLK
jgi:hypothetical protein